MFLVQVTVGEVVGRFEEVQNKFWKLGWNKRFWERGEHFLVEFWHQGLSGEVKNRRIQKGGNNGIKGKEAGKVGRKALEGIIGGIRHFGVMDSGKKIAKEDRAQEWEYGQGWKGGFGRESMGDYEQKYEQPQGKEKGIWNECQVGEMGWIGRNQRDRRKGSRKKGKKDRKKGRKKNKTRNSWRRRGKGKAGKKYVRIGEAKNPGPEWVRHRGEEEGERDRRELRNMKKAVEAMLERMERLGRELSKMRMIEWKRREQVRWSAWRWERRVWDEVKEVKSRWEGDKRKKGGGRKREKEEKQQ